MFKESNAPAMCPECSAELSADGKRVMAISTRLRQRAALHPEQADLYAQGLKRFLRESKCATCKAAGRLPAPAKAAG